MSENNLWIQVGNECLGQALELLKSETVSTAGTVETVERLVNIAIAIDTLDLQWKLKTKTGLNNGSF